SLGTLIYNYVSNILPKYQEQSNLSVNDMKNDPNMKMMSKYIRGGISKLTKSDLKTLTEVFINYKKDRYFVNEKEIIPDPEQFSIIKADTDYNIRVIAGAGTGKTTTI